MTEAAIYESKPKRLSSVLLSELSEFVEIRMGLHFPEERRLDLERSICSAARDFGFKDAGSYIKWLISSPLSQRQIEALASHLTVGETYFFRDKKTFDILEERVIPEIIQSREGKEQRIRIWSAGCSTGEEPYSIAILLDKNIPELKDWNIAILATDINVNFLKKASEAVYSEWSFRDTPRWVKEKYFKKTKMGYEILDRIRNMVTFSYHNLVEDPYPSLMNSTNAMDIICCRNVLMYFSQGKSREVINNFYRCLVDSGWLIVGPVETSSNMASLFETVNFGSTIMHRKTGIKKAISELPPIIPEPIPRFPASEPPPEVNNPLLNNTSQPPFNLRGGEGELKGSYDSGGDAGEVIPIEKEVLNANALSLRAHEFANQGRLSDALECCEKAINADKLNPSLYYLNATILQEMGEDKEAAGSLKKVIYLDSNFALAHFALGHLMHKQGKYKESERHFEHTRSLLNMYGHDDILPESEGISAGRLMEIIEIIQKAETKRTS